MTDVLEREFRLRATKPIEVAAIDAALREAGLQCTATDSTKRLDTYLDGDSGQLRQAGIGLRLREDRRGRHLGCKHSTQRQGALFVRTELEEPWPLESLPRSAAELPVALRDLVEPFLLDGHLTVQLQLETQRETRQMSADGQSLGEVAIDHVVTAIGPRQQQFVEVEIEAHDDLAGCERLANQLTTTLPLTAAEDDKPTFAAALLGLPAPPPGGPSTLADATAAAAITAIARRHFSAMQGAEAGVRSGLDPAHLHGMRVALRRLRSLVRAFRSLWPEATANWLQAEFAATAERLGKVRDLDVMLASLPTSIATLPTGLHDGAHVGTAWIRDQRAREHEALLGWLRDPERLAHTRQQREALVVPEGTLGNLPLAGLASAKLGEAAGKVRRLAKALDPELPHEPMHELRLACKRLRYLGEEFHDLPGLAMGKSLAVLTKLQLSLGAVCDHETAAARLIGWLPNLLQELPAAAPALAGLATSHHLAAQAARKRASKHVRRAVRQKLWRAFPKPPERDANVTP